MRADPWGLLVSEPSYAVRSRPVRDSDFKKTKGRSVPTALTEDQGLVPSTHMAARGSAFSFGLLRYQAGMWQTNKYAGKFSNTYDI